MTSPLSRTLLATTTFVILLAAIPAMAGDMPGDEVAETTKLDFSALDKNKDGALSADEIPENEALSMDFPDVDSDGDGKLSKDEFDTYNQ